MGQSYRIKTELGVNKTINVQLDQDFEFLEILSLKIQQSDIYTRSCADYGVIVGRVTANNGFGIPNARVSVFIPIRPLDESNPIISSIYPYKSPSDKNEDGYRYNLLPFEKSYSAHAATGTLPSRDGALTGLTEVEIYDTYYKYSTKTNESGDYMIMGAPLGSQTLVMDVDLSDIGEFSLTPQDLIRMGLATEGQVAGNRFKTSNDLNSLPQIISLTKQLDVSPLWGDPDICQIAVNRVDFDLRDDANVDIQPTSVFMGSIYSTSDSFRLRKNARPRDNMGNLCSLTTGPGQILAIRQTIQEDTDGNPILEQYQLEQSGNIIDGNGVWMTELPMNLDYFITNEFGEKVLSNDPTVGIPTKGRYRFKVKWSQSSSVSEQTRRPNFLIPNVKEYGWGPSSITNEERQESSYYFGLDWSGYTKGFNTHGDINLKNNILNSKINCEDTFYEFQFNRVYTVSSFVDQFKNGGKGRFIGIKEIDSQECEDSVNKFPVNDGFRNFDLIFFIFSLILQIIQLIGLPLIIVYHFIAFLWNNFAVPLLTYFIIQFGVNAYLEFAAAQAAAAGASGFSFGLLLLILPFILKGLLWTAIALFLSIKFKQIVEYRFGRIKLPMITYPECQTCECVSESTSPNTNSENGKTPTPGLLSQLSNGVFYNDNLVITNQSISDRTWPGVPITDDNYDSYFQIESIGQGVAIAGMSSNNNNPYKYKVPISPTYTFPNNRKMSFNGITLPVGERINVYNTRKKYFDNVNKIKVTFSYPNNGSTHHFDNTLTVLSTTNVEPGTLLSFVNLNKTKDVNYLWTGLTQEGGYILNGIDGILKTQPFTTNVSYATTQTTSQVVTYNIPSGETECVQSIEIKITEPGTVTYKTCPGNRVVVSFTGQTTGTTNPNGIISVDFPLTTTLSNVDCINLTQLGGTAEYTVVSTGEGCQRYIYPSDIEYYQVLTAITITKTIVNGQPQYSIPGSDQLGPSFWKVLNAENRLISIGDIDSDIRWLPIKYPNYFRNPVEEQKYNYTFIDNNLSQASWEDFNPDVIYDLQTSNFQDFSEQKILILQRGVDPYSPLMVNKYGIGKILGYENEDDVTFTAMTRMNIPIQTLPSNNEISVQNHRNQNNISYGSYFYTPNSDKYSAYTTPNVGFYGALDKNGSTIKSPFIQNPATSLSSDSFVESFSVNPTINGVKTKSINRVYSQTDADNLYDGSEDLSGAGILFLAKYYKTRLSFINFGGGIMSGLYKILVSPFPTQPQPSVYFSPILYPSFTGINETNMFQSNNIVMRTDRLPSSDFIDNNENLNGSVSLLQQNLGFAVYDVGANGLGFNNPSISLGADLVSPDIGGLPNATNVLSTLGDCEKMVGLSCYKTTYGPDGVGNLFEVSPGCQSTDAVENGCYILMNRALIDLGKDLKTFAEWGFRFRFFYGLCRGVLSQSFMNNWVNGGLYMFPIQVDINYDRNNQPSDPDFANEVVYFDKSSNNFYYRSSPFRLTGSTGEGKFVGRPVDGLTNSVNRRNLLFPTTIINLGIKDDFYQEIIFDPSAKGFIMKSLNPTSYSDTSDLVNLFVISRITDEGFLRQILAFGDNSLQQLFSRNGSSRRIDGDLAQSMSINSEFGVIPFSPEFYQVTGSISDPVRIIGPLKNPTMAIFFSSTTQDLQYKDFLSPGVIDFRPSNNTNAITYKYGIKSQEVPFYQWEIKDKPESGVFGTERNSWLTGTNDIFSRNYQSLDRRDIITPSYLIPSSYPISDTFARGYIFNVTGTSFNDFNYSLNGGNYERKVLVGAPNHFYFGVIKGETALDKFKEKYSIDE
jgi:hypothetical protein